MPRSAPSGLATAASAGGRRQHLQGVIRRVNSVTGRTYRDDPAVFGYDLINEGRATAAAAAALQARAARPLGRYPEYRVPINILQAWYAEAAAAVKALDPNHLVATGEEGWFGARHAPRATAADVRA